IKACLRLEFDRVRMLLRAAVRRLVLVEREAQGDDFKADVLDPVLLAARFRLASDVRAAEIGELRDQRGIACLIDVAAISRGIDEVSQGISGAEQYLQHIRRRGKRAAPHTVEHCLEYVGKFHELVQRKRAGTALYRMHGTEYRIDRLGI